LRPAPAHLPPLLSSPLPPSYSVVVLVRSIEKVEDKSHRSRIRCCFFFVRSLVRPAAAPLPQQSQRSRDSHGGQQRGRPSGSIAPSFARPLLLLLYSFFFSYFPSLSFPALGRSPGPYFLASPHSLVHQFTALRPLRRILIQKNSRSRPREMQYVRSISGSVSKTWNSINPATLSGAIDVIVVEQEDGERCSGSHRRLRNGH